MSTPRFLDRVADAVGPVLGLQGDALRQRLDVAVALRAVGAVPPDGWLLSANLLARLYPRVEISGDPSLVEAASKLILEINPLCDIGEHEVTAALTWNGPTSDVASEVVVAAWGANIGIDCEAPSSDGAVEPLAALIAAAAGVGEVFRAVFAPELGDRGRTAPTPAAFNIVTLGEPLDLPASLMGIDLGCVALVGAGAIGQSAALALTAAAARGHVNVVDPESVDQSNLQRYVLTNDTDEDVEKVKIVSQRLRGAGMTTNALRRRWSAELVTAQLDAVLVGLDSERDRIGVAASLPRTAYNAWTQQRDLGWSRHESFGDEPCLACLYWPTGPKPHQHETLASELGQHPLRVLAYLVGGVPAGAPLPPELPATPLLPAPPDASEWSLRSILEDIAAEWGVEADRLAHWRDRPLTSFHQEVICAGALMDLPRGGHDAQALVPLAHQSALAGVMLAVQALVARQDDLRELRPNAIEARWDVLKALPQVMPVPRRRTARCLCADPDFLTASRESR